MGYFLSCNENEIFKHKKQIRVSKNVGISLNILIEITEIVITATVASIMFNKFFIILLTFKCFDLLCC